MKVINRILTAFMTAVVAFAMVPLAFAAGTRSITITSPAGVASDVENTYTIIKVFNASAEESADNTGHIRYSFIPGKPTTITATDGNSMFEADAAGNVVYKEKDAEGNFQINTTTTELSPGMIAAIKAYVTGFPTAATVKITGPQNPGTANNLEDGYYFISTTTGTVVTIDSTTPNASVIDKNEMTTVVKSAGTSYDENALAVIQQVGSNQPFTSQIELGKGAINVVFTDTMTNMKYNNDVKVYVGGAEVAAGESTFTVSPEDNLLKFSVNFNNDYIKGLAAKTVIVLKYSAKVTSDALSVNPATNQATVTFGDGGKNHSDSQVVNVYNAKLAVKKWDGKKADNKGLEKAGFVIKDTGVNSETKDKYYKIGTVDGVTTVTWVANIDDATEYKSDASGVVPTFTGLKAGNYTLVEKTVPAGYNRAADQTFEIEDVPNNNLAAEINLTADVENFQGTELPSTGGIGTTIFYIVGGVMVAGAIVFLLTKRRVGIGE